MFGNTADFKATSVPVGVKSHMCLHLTRAIWLATFNRIDLLFFFSVLHLTGLKALYSFRVDRLLTCRQPTEAKGGNDRVEMNLFLTFFSFLNGAFGS